MATVAEKTKRTPRKNTPFTVSDYRQTQQEIQSQSTAGEDISDVDISSFGMPVLITDTHPTNTQKS
jgi:hypothetical protein